MAAKPPERAGNRGWRLNEEFDHQGPCKVFLTTYRKFLTKEFGPRCKARCNGCACCEVWSLYDLTEVLFP